MFLPEQRQQPLAGLLQDPAAVWLQVPHSRRYLETREEALCWFAAAGGGEGHSEATAAAAGLGGAGPPGRLEFGVCVVAALTAVVAVTAVVTFAAAAIVIAAVASVAFAAAAVVTANAVVAAATSAAPQPPEQLQMSTGATRELES